jgi:regulatory protein
MSDGHQVDKTDLTKIRRLILYWLTRRDHTQFEILQKLAVKGYDQTSAQNIVDELTQAGLISESRFTENFLHWRRQRGFGPMRILAELKARGVTPETIAEHLDITDNAWLIEAQRIWRKHFKGKPPQDYAARAKQMRFLQYRGYTREQISRVIGEIEE